MVVVMYLIHDLSFFMEVASGLGSLGATGAYLGTCARIKQPYFPTKGLDSHSLARHGQHTRLMPR